MTVGTMLQQVSDANPRTCTACGERIAEHVYGMSVWIDGRPDSIECVRDEHVAPARVSVGIDPAARALGLYVLLPFTAMFVAGCGLAAWRLVG